MHEGSTPLSVLNAWSVEIERCRQAYPSVGGYLLVDAGGFSATDQAWINQHACANLFEGTRDDVHAHLGPRLLLLPSSPAFPDWLGRLSRLEHRDPCVHWIWTRETPDGLNNRLQTLLNGKLENGREAMIRYFDRMVWRFLSNHLNEEQTDRFFAPCVVWQSWGVDSWNAVLGQDLPELTLDRTSLLWTDEQVYRINLAGLPMQLFQDLQGDFPDLLTKENQPVREHQFAQAVQKADAWGITTYRDFMVFTILSMTVSATFDAHPDVAAQLKRVREHGAKFFDVVDDVPRSAWAALGAPARSELF